MQASFPNAPRSTPAFVLALALLVLPPVSSSSPYVVVLVIDLLIAALFAASSDCRRWKLAGSAPSCE